MKKRIWTIVLAVVLVLAVGAGIYMVTRSSKPEIPPEEPAGDKPSVVVYVPDEQAETLTATGAQAADDSDQALVDVLISMNALPAGVEVKSSSAADGVLTLDMNAAYGDAIRSSGTAGETMLIYALVDTFVQARGVEQVLLTVEGKTLESGHEIYDTPLEMGYTS